MMITNEAIKLTKGIMSLIMMPATGRCVEVCYYCIIFIMLSLCFTLMSMYCWLLRKAFIMKPWLADLLHVWVLLNLQMGHCNFWWKTFCTLHYVTVTFLLRCFKINIFTLNNYLVVHLLLHSAQLCLSLNTKYKQVLPMAQLNICVLIGMDANPKAKMANWSDISSDVV